MKRKNVEDETGVGVTLHLNGSMSYCWLHIKVCAHRLLYRVRKLKTVLKFLLFREDNPKFGLWSDCEPLHLALVVPFFVYVASLLSLYGYVFLGVVGFCLGFCLGLLFPIEVFHCILEY